jgi:uncharacterized protein with ParB-like and HNH nuclease domain
MSTKTIEQFFTGKSLEIPPYQRDYAWLTVNVDDLFEDIQEAMDIGGGHYLGTFILSAGDAKDRFKVVDGQQRLTTLTMLLKALVDALSDGELKTYYRSTFLRHPVQGQKFTVLGNNQEFFISLLDNIDLQPSSEGQRRLKAAYDWIRQRIHAIKSADGENSIQNWLLNIGKLEVLEFIEPNEGKAIRMFQSVNDRGVPLSKMDIAKSLLIYYSNRFLDGELDHFIADQFGTAFRDYSSIKGLASENGYQIRVIDRNTFREDDVFRYHYFSFNTDKYNVGATFDYNATSETVLEFFLKPTLKLLRSDKTKLKTFIQEYVADLAQFFSAFWSLISEIKNDKNLYLLFVIGDLAATLYPLIIRLAMRGILKESVPNANGMSLMQLIEIADLRVFKLRGTNPQADILNLTREAGEKPIQEIVNCLKYFVSKFMDDGLFESRLSQENLYRNPGLLRILNAWEEKQRLEHKKSEIQLNDLIELVKTGQTVEHILPQTTSFGIRAYGFHSSDLYENNIHRLGNLTLLESDLNSSCNNQSVETKMTGKKLYRNSKYESTKFLSASNARKTPPFSRVEIDNRGSELAKFCVAEWPISK